MKEWSSVHSVQEEKGHLKSSGLIAKKCCRGWLLLKKFLDDNEATSMIKVKNKVLVQPFFFGPDWLKNAQTFCWHFKSCEKLSKSFIYHKIIMKPGFTISDTSILKASSKSCRKEVVSRLCVPESCTSNYKTTENFCLRNCFQSCIGFKRYLVTVKPQSNWIKDVVTTRFGASYISYKKQLIVSSANICRTSKRKS